MNFLKIYRLLILQLLFAACLLPAMIFSYRHAFYNMDMLSYMAVILEMNGRDTQQIHQEVYESIRKEVPALEQGYLIHSPDGHREKMMNDKAYFNSQLPFYRVKPLYTGFSWLLYNAGFPLTSSTYIPSIVAYFLIGLLLFYWLSRIYNPLFAWVIGLLFMYSSFMISVARTSAPDCLSAFFLLAAFYFILQRPSVRWMFVCLLLSIFSRMDNAVTALMILAALTHGKRWEKNIPLKAWLPMLIIIVGCYLFISSCATNGEWSIWYYPDFMKRFNTAHVAGNNFSFSDYFGLLYSKLITGIVFSSLSLFLFLVVLILYDTIVTRKLSFDQFFIVVLLLILTVRFILFPDVSDRFYIAYYLVIVLLFSRKYMRLIRAFRGN